MDISLKRPDYRKYCWKKGEKAGAIVFCAAITGFLACFFYRSAVAALPLSGIGVWLYGKTAADKAKRQRRELTAQFRECILSVAASLQAGYSVENAFVECRQDMRLLYGEEACLVRELDIVRRGLAINISLEELLVDLARRSACDDITQFAQIFSIAKRNGGNMTEIIQSSADQIGKQIELKQEMETLLGGKRMELGIMKAVPFGILLYINVGNPGYFDSLYHNLTGAAIMTGCLAVYLSACAMGERIMDKLL